MSYDPDTRAKTEQYGNSGFAQANPVSAIPVSVVTSAPTQPYTHAVGTIAAPPQGMYPNSPQQAYMQPVYTGNNIPQNQQQRRQYPRGRWGDSICDWPLNLFPSCYCVCCVCCGIYLAAQIGQKVGYSNFISVLWAFAAMCVIGFFVQIFTANNAWIVWIPLAFAGIYAIGLRMYIAKKENITECGNNPALGECCVGFWCFYCSVAQMARHVFGYTKVLDGDSDPYRPDGYATAQEV
jgi:hypothetical protein